MQRSRIAGIIASGVLLCGWSCSPGAADRPAESATAAAPAATSPSATAEELAPIDAADRQSQEEADAAYALPDVSGVKWTGDLDGMVQRRIIRVLTTYSKVNYFVDQGRPRGLVYDAFRLFEDDLNAQAEDQRTSRSTSSSFRSRTTI